MSNQANASRPNLKFEKSPQSVTIDTLLDAQYLCYITFYIKERKLSFFLIVLLMLNITETLLASLTTRGLHFFNLNRSCIYRSD